MSWCDTTRYTYCFRLNSTNVTGTQTQFEKKLFAGDTYKFYVQAITTYGVLKESIIQVSVPPLNLKVSYVSGYTTGRYGLQIYLYWRRWYIPYSQVVVSMYASCFCLPCSPQRVGGGGYWRVPDKHGENRGTCEQTSGGRGTYEFWMACATCSQCQTKIIESQTWSLKLILYFSRTITITVAVAVQSVEPRYNDMPREQ